MHDHYKYNKTAEQVKALLEPSIAEGKGVLTVQPYTQVSTTYSWDWERSRSYPVESIDQALEIIHAYKDTYSGGSGKDRVDVSYTFAYDYDDQWEDPFIIIEGTPNPEIGGLYKRWTIEFQYYGRTDSYWPGSSLARKEQTK